VIVAFYGIPKSERKWKQKLMRSGEIRPMKKPDSDNIAKVILDALNGIAFRDDSQVIDLHVTKHYSDDPRVEIYLRGMEEAE